MSDLSDIYGQFEASLMDAREQYDESLERWSEALVEDHRTYLDNHLYSFGADFQTQIGRMQARQFANSFFGQENIPFVAIDGSCDKEDQQGFISFYGGAYGSKGQIKFQADSAKIEYERWEFSKDVSMVAFLPMPPDQLTASVENTGGRFQQMFTDAELRNLSSIHTKIMQLAEIYLAYSQVESGVEYPRLLLLDLSLGGLLGNTSYSPDSVELTAGSFEGSSLNEFDLRVGLAHPYNDTLGIPSANRFQPWNNILHAGHVAGRDRVTVDDAGLDDTTFQDAAKRLEGWGAATRLGGGEVELAANPRSAWRRCVTVFETICHSLFREKDISALMYEGDDGEPRFMKPEDITFLTGIGLRKLIETCWRDNILLVGVAKDSTSRYFYRNFLGSAACTGKVDPKDYREIQLSDRKIIELLAHILPEELHAPWGTIEFDSTFMTLHPEVDDETDEVSVKGYQLPGNLPPVMRPERIFLRSIPIYLLDRERGMTSHAIFVDRLAYPGWDDEDSVEWPIDVHRIGEVSPLYYDVESGPPRLQQMSQYLLSILVRNHFPDALGYPDPLHKADWGAKSMKRRVKSLMQSGQIAMNAKPLERSMRRIRESFRR